MIIFYRILTYILMPLGAIFGFLTLASLLASAANVAALLPTFLCGAAVIYIVTSFIFLHKGMLDGQLVKPSLYDWIRVNGFVALFMGSLFIFQSIYLKDNTELTEQLQIQMDAMTEQMEEIDEAKMPDLERVVNWVLTFMLVSGILLVSHVFLTFSFLRKYARLFGR
jgi:hypothetical protein